jgi:hypothetical protein
MNASPFENALIEGSEMAGKVGTGTTRDEIVVAASFRT